VTHVELHKIYNKSRNNVKKYMVTLYFHQRANTGVYFLYAITNIVVSITFIFDSNNAKGKAFHYAALPSIGTPPIWVGISFFFFFFQSVKLIYV